MSKMLWMIIILFSVMLLSFGLASVFVAIEVPNAESLTEKVFVDEILEYDVDSIDSLIATMVTADVRLIPTQDDKIRVHFKGEFYAKDNNTLPEFVIVKNGGSLRMQLDQPVGNWFFKSITKDVSLDIYVPENKSLNLALDTVSGKVDVGLINVLDCMIDTVSGAVEFNPLSNEGCNIETTSGKIIATNLVSTLNNDIESISGAIYLNNLTGRVEVDSVSGKIDVSYLFVDGDSDFESISGEVNVKVPNNSDVVIYADSVSGSVNVNGFNVVKNKDYDLEAEKGNGVNKIFIETISGSITLV